jgi:hypothetical protein
MTNKKIIGGVITEIVYTLAFLFVLYGINMILAR